MTMEKKKPEIRFNGFEGEWVTTTLGDIAVRVVSKNEDNSITLPLTISAQYGLISQTEFFNSRIAAKDVRGYYVIKKGEFAYNRSTSDFSPFGAVKRLDGYEAGVLSTLYIVFRLSSEQIQSNYLVNYFSTSNWYQHITESAAEGARNHGLLNITAEDFFKTPIKAPIRTEEQEKIASFLTTLDKLIAKLEAKLDKLRKLKQALLEKMFVNVNGGGYETPEIRFKGYTDKWQVKELKNYFIVATERNQSEKYNKYDIYSVSREFGVINQIEYQGKSFAGASLANYGIVQTGDLVYTKSPLKSQPYGIIKTNEGEAGIVSALYGVYHPKECVHSPFTQVYFDLNSRLNNYLRPLVNKGAKNTLLISDEDSLNGRVAFPSKDEQKVIAHLFKEHNLCERKTELKLTKLRNIKQSLLQKMFA